MDEQRDVFALRCLHLDLKGFYCFHWDGRIEKTLQLCCTGSVQFDEDKAGRYFGVSTASLLIGGSSELHLDEGHRL